MKSLKPESAEGGSAALTPPRPLIAPGPSTALDKDTKCFHVALDSTGKRYGTISQG